MQDGFFENFSKLNNNSGIVEIIGNHSLEELFYIQSQNVDRVLRIKGYELMKAVLVRVSIPDFEKFHVDFIENHNFQNFTYEEYCTGFEAAFGFSLLERTREVYNERGFPQFYFRDISLKKVNTEGDMLFSIKVWNRGGRPGIITIFMESRGTEKFYALNAGDCKEIRILTTGREKNHAVRMDVGLSENFPSYFYLELDANAFSSSSVEGVYEADTLSFLPSPGEYVVDDEDSGFHILKNEKYISKYKIDKDWKKSYNRNSYGEAVRSYWVKESGSTNIDIEWETELQKSGRYELWIYSNKKYIRQLTDIVYGNKSKNENSIQRYRFVHADGEEEIELDLLDEDDGWVLLGEYYYEAGKTKLTLIGKGANEYQWLYADAVKWVEIK